MAYTVMTYTVMAFIVMAYTVMAYVVMAGRNLEQHRRAVFGVRMYVGAKREQLDDRRVVFVLGPSILVMAAD